MLVELSTLCLGILCTISCIFLKAWPTAPLYLIYCFVVLYTFCGLGTVVEKSVSLRCMNVPQSLAGIAFLE